MTTKYELAKESARSWHRKYTELQSEYELLSQNSQQEIARWKALAEDLPDHETVNEHLKQIKSLRRQLHDNEEKYQDKIAKLEREKLLLEGRIQQLEEGRKDLQDRYNELKEDYRWLKGEKGKSG